MTRLWPSLLGAAQVVQPETILRWHRAGFTAFWRWKSRKRAGRPKIDRELRDLIRRMSKENPKWGASRIHGELLMLGFEVAQSTVSKYMVRGRSPSQGWKTFFRNHAQAIAAIDLFVVPTLTFERLFAVLVLGHGRRQLLWFEVTRHPTAEWLARQITEAFPWASAPAYLVRDNDRAYGAAFRSRVRAMGIRALGRVRVSRRRQLRPQQRDAHAVPDHRDHQDVNRGLAEIPVGAIDRQNPWLAGKPQQVDHHARRERAVEPHKTGRTDKTTAAPSRSAPRSPQTPPAATGISFRAA
jgi:hypothetical protein